MRDLEPELATAPPEAVSRNSGLQPATPPALVLFQTYPAKQAEARGDAPPGYGLQSRSAGEAPDTPDAPNAPDAYRLML